MPYPYNSNIQILTSNFQERQASPLHIISSLILYSALYKNFRPLEGRKHFPRYHPAWARSGPLLAGRRVFAFCRPPLTVRYRRGLLPILRFRPASPGCIRSGNGAGFHHPPALWSLSLLLLFPFIETSIGMTLYYYGIPGGVKLIIERHPGKKRAVRPAGNHPVHPARNDRAAF